MPLALIGARIIDGTGKPPVENGTVVIDGTKIVEVSQQHEFGSVVQTVDVTGMSIMPGMIDCHQHFGGWFQWLFSEQKKSLMYLSSQTTNFLKGCLEAGCTTARDMGGLEAGFRDAVKDGLIPGPRLKTALVIIQPTNGITDNLPGLGGAITPQGLYAGAPGLPSPWCDGPWEARKKVREVLRYGADVIKIANEGIPSPRFRPDRTLFQQDELDAIVDEAHKAGVPVGSHAYSHESVMMVLRAGVDSIEEGCFLDEECVEEMAKRGVWYVPCLSNPHWHVAHNHDPAMREWNMSVVESNKRAFVLAMQAGVPIAMGTDSGYAVGEAALELGWMVDAGMSPAQAIAVSTGRAAEFLRMGNQVGTLERGKEADLLVLEGNPLQDIGVVSRNECLALVMQAGKGVAGTKLSQLPRQTPERPRSWF